MDIKAAYELIGSYKDVLGRIPAEALIKKFALKFLDDGSFGSLKEAMEAGNTEEAFRAAHTLKGVCGNLGLTKLADTSSLLTEALRAGNMEEAKKLYPAVEESYQLTVDTLRQLD